jgi:hypothetical protein
MRTKKEKLERRLARVRRLTRIPTILFFAIGVVLYTVVSVLVDIGFALWDNEAISWSSIVSSLPSSAILALFLTLAMYSVTWYQQEELESELKYLSEGDR